MWTYKTLFCDNITHTAIINIQTLREQFDTAKGIHSYERKWVLDTATALGTH